jgi:hypothetical protein
MAGACKLRDCPDISRPSRASPDDPAEKPLESSGFSHVGREARKAWKTFAASLAIPGSLC